MVRVKRNEPWPAGRLPSDGQHPRIVGVEDVPAPGPGDPGDAGFDFRQLVERPDPVLIEVVFGHVGHDRHVIVVGADPAQ